MSRPVFGFLLLAPLLSRQRRGSCRKYGPQRPHGLSSAPASIGFGTGAGPERPRAGQGRACRQIEDGKPALSFRANDGRLVVIAASATSYDGKVVVTSNDQPQIAALVGTGTRTAAK